MIDQTAAEISRFFVIFKMAAAAVLNFQKFKILTVRTAVGGQFASLYQILSKSVIRLHRYSDLLFFSKWRPSAILGLLGAYWDHQRRPLDVLCRCAKFGWNRCSSFDNMKLSIFCRFGLKTPIHAPKIGVFGAFYPQNGKQCQRNPQKAHPCANPRRLSHQAWKSVDGSDL